MALGHLHLQNCAATKGRADRAAEVTGKAFSCSDNFSSIFVAIQTNVAYCKRAGNNSSLKLQHQLKLLGLVLSDRATGLSLL